MSLSELMTPKQVQVLDQELNNSDWNLMINHGAVRSGKTFVDNFVFLYEVKHAAETAHAEGFRKPLYILGGVSSKTIQNNILNEISETFGIEFNFDKHNSFKVKFPGLPAVTIVQAFTGSIAGLGAIRGMTSYGAYINEASMANELVFNEIRKRCSRDGARVVCDTNPDVPTHWLKKKYIDNPKHLKQIVVNHFEMDDNTFLSPKYIADQKATTPTGMFYDRDILGLWVAGEGLVYQDYDKDKNKCTRTEFERRTSGQQLTYYCGVDWGYEHKGVIVVLADDEQGNTYLIEEHTKQHQDIDYWVKIARDIQNRYGWNVPFYCDSARPEYCQRFDDEHFNMQYAYKSILRGIEVNATGIKNGHFFVLKDVTDSPDSRFEDELYEYAWDEKSGEPKKENDDVMDAWRYAKVTHMWEANNRDDTNLKQQAQMLADKGLIDIEPDDDHMDPWDMY